MKSGISPFPPFRQRSRLHFGVRYGDVGKSALRNRRDGQDARHKPPYRRMAWLRNDGVAISCGKREGRFQRGFGRSEEHTSELQSLMRISYAVFCLKKKKYAHNSR